MQLYFLRPGDTRNRDALDQLVRAISEPQGLVRAAVAYLTHDRLVDAVLARQEQGLPTRVLLNSSDIIRPVNPTTSELVVARAMVRLIEKAWWRDLEVRSLGMRGDTYQNMHHKFVVSDDVVAFGSVNWTRAALNNNYECLAVSRDGRDIAQFQREFDELWEKAFNLEVSGKTVRSIVCPGCKCSGTVDLESYGPFCTSCRHEFRVADAV